MKSKSQGGETKKMSATAAVRSSISFPPDVYEALENIARGKKVSLAWVVRDAAEDYLAKNGSLLVKPRQ